MPTTSEIFQIIILATVSHLHVGKKKADLSENGFKIKYTQRRNESSYYLKYFKNFG